MRQASFYCPQCQQMKLFQQEEMSHTPHIIAAIFLCGLWLPVWAIIAATYDPPWHCSFCGFSDAVAYLADPNRRQREWTANAAMVERAAHVPIVEHKSNAAMEFIRHHQRIIAAAAIGVGVAGAVAFAMVY